MTTHEMIAWLGLAAAGVGLLGVVTSWFSAEASDNRFLFYVTLILAGLIAFFTLR